MAEQEKPLSEYTVEELEDQLTDKQRKFVHEYLENGLNATQAALAVYATESYKTAKAMGTENLSKPYIRALVNRYHTKYAMGMEETLQRLGAIARADLGDIMEINPDGTGTISLELAKKYGLTHLIKETETKKRREKQKGGDVVEYIDVKVKLHNAHDALKDIARIHGMFKDQIGLQVEGVVGVLKTGEAASPEEWVQNMKAYREEFQKMEANFDD